MTNRIISLLVGLLLLSVNAFALQVQAENISSDKYFEVTLNEINSAKSSIQSYELLKKNNVPVFFDTSDTYTHAKAIIIDNETVILGSTNWSKAALTRNNEANVLIRSKEFAAHLINRISSGQVLGTQYSIPAIKVPFFRLWTHNFPQWFG